MPVGKVVVAEVVAPAEADAVMQVLWVAPFITIIIVVAVVPIIITTMASVVSLMQPLVVQLELELLVLVAEIATAITLAPQIYKVPAIPNCGNNKKNKLKITFYIEYIDFYTNSIIILFTALMPVHILQVRRIL